MATNTRIEIIEKGSIQTLEKAINDFIVSIGNKQIYSVDVHADPLHNGNKIYVAIVNYDNVTASALPPSVKLIQKDSIITLQSAVNAYITPLSKPSVITGSNLILKNGNNSFIAVVGYNFTPSGGDAGATAWQTIEIPLTQLDMQTLNSANGGFGFKMFTALAGLKVYQFANPRLFINNSSGIACWSVAPAGVCYIYDSIYFNFHFFSNVFVNNVGGVLDGLDSLPNPSVLFTNSVDGLILNSAPSSYPVSAPPGSRGSIQLPGGETFLWTDEDYPTFEGSAKLRIDYRILNSF